MSSSTQDEIAINLYNFWAWQYTARNSGFKKNREYLLETVKDLARNGIMSEHVALDTVARELSWAHCDTLFFESPVQSGWATRCPTEYERTRAIKALELQEYFSKLHYNISDISLDAVAANEILNNIDNYTEIFKFPCKKIYTSPYPFRTVTMLFDEDTIRGGIFNIQIGNKINGKHSISLDFSLPIETIITQIKAIYEQLNSTNLHETNTAIKFLLHSKGGVTNFSVASRVIGLWLWDYVQEHGGDIKRGAVTAAIRNMKTALEQRTLDAFGFAYSEENVFRGFYRKTRACIEACEVLSFK